MSKTQGQLGQSFRSWTVALGTYTKTSMTDRTIYRKGACSAPGDHHMSMTDRPTDRQTEIVSHRRDLTQTTRRNEIVHLRLMNNDETKQAAFEGYHPPTYSSSSSSPPPTRVREDDVYD